MRHMGLAFHRLGPWAPLLGAMLITTIVSASASQEAELPPGEGRDLVIRLCSDCHGLNASVTTRRTLGAWEDVMIAMQGRGVGGTDEELGQVVRYLARAYGKIEINTADARSLQVVLEVTPAVAEALVKARPFASLADLKNVPGIDMKAMEARKDRMVFAPAQPMRIGDGY